MNPVPSPTCNLNQAPPTPVGPRSVAVFPAAGIKAGTVALLSLLSWVVLAVSLLGGIASTAAATGDPEEGACCIVDGFCILRTASGCDDMNGDYQGDGTNCDPNPCPQPPQGACCLEHGRCTVRSEFNCVDVNGGEYQGDDTSCDPNPCPQPPTGACCDFEDGSCVVLPDHECNHDYLGDGTDCDPHPCPPVGACCDPGSGSCEVSTEELCEDGLSNWQGEGSDCDPDPCPQPGYGACCNPVDGSCEFTTEGYCDGDREYQGDDTNCDPNPCPQPPTGACCDDDGSCVVLTEHDCGRYGYAHYEGDGTSCEPNPCPQIERACCLPDESCVFLSEEDCVAEGGEYQGDHAVFCEPTTCTDVPRGACCTESGCFIVTEEECGSGFYAGDGSVCGSDPCDEDSPSLRITASIYGKNAEVDFVVAGPEGDFNGRTPAHLTDLEEGLYEVTWIRAGHRGCTELYFVGDGELESAHCDLLPYFTSPDRFTPDREPNAVQDESLVDLTFSASVRPNPARNFARIEWASPVASPTELTIYDAAGRVLRRLLSEDKAIGRHQAEWDGRDGSGAALPSGIYYYRLRLQETGEQVTDKIYLLR